MNKSERVTRVDFLHFTRISISGLNTADTTHRFCLSYSRIQQALADSTRLGSHLGFAFTTIGDSWSDLYFGDRTERRQQDVSACPCPAAVRHPLPFSPYKRLPPWHPLRLSILHLSPPSPLPLTHSSWYTS